MPQSLNQAATSRKELLLVGACATLIAGLIQAFWLSGPLERDQSIYFLIGHLLNKGRYLYSDLWDHKPPAIHVAYMLAQTIVGYSKQAIWLLGTALAASSTVGLYILLRQFSNRLGIFLSLTIFLLLNQSPNLEASQPNAEAFINCLWIWSTVLLLQNQTRPKQELLAVGLCALASLFKPFAVIFFVPLFIANLLHRQAKPFEIIRSLAMFCLIPLLLWILTFIYFAISGRAALFIEAVFTYNRHYAGDLTQNVLNLFSSSHLLPRSLYALCAPFILSLLLLLTAISKPNLRNMAVILLGSICLAYIGIALPGNFYLHYYQYLLPVLAIAAGLAITNLNKLPAAILTCTTLGLIVAHEMPLITSPHTERRSPLYPFSDNAQVQKLAPIILKHLSPAGSFYLWGPQAALYFETGIDPAHGALHVSWLQEGPAAQRLSAQTLTSLEASPPVIVVVSKKFATNKALENKVYSWITKNYGVLPNHELQGEFVLLAKK